MHLYSPIQSAIAAITNAKSEIASINRSLESLNRADDLDEISVLKRRKFYLMAKVRENRKVLSGLKIEFVEVK